MPHTARESTNTTVTSNNPLYPALEAPRAPIPTPALTLEEYAEIAADDRGINSELFSALIRCESQWNEKAVGDGGTSFGLLQFKKKTFAHFTAKYKLPDYDLRNSYHQIDLAARMIKDGYIQHWETCARKLGWI